MIPSIGRGRASVVPAWMQQQQQHQQTVPGGVPAYTSAPVAQQQQQPGMYSFAPPPLTALVPPLASSAAAVAAVAAGTAMGMAPQQVGGGLVTFLPPSHLQQHPLLTPYSTHGWTEARTPEGKTYYSNSLTGESTFEKPDQLKTAAERQLPSSPWKEYVRDYKSYYVNSATKQSLWEEPMELTLHRERLRAMCAGEPPTRDMTSLALYTAAQRALQELTVDVDGTLAKKRAEHKPDEINAAASRQRAKIELKEISGDLMRGKQPDAMQRSDPDQFLQMLEDWKVPADATWDAAFALGIAADARYDALPTLQARKQVVAERRARAPPPPPAPTASEVLEEQRQALNALLDELEADQALGPRSTFAALLPVFELRLPFKLPVEEAKQWFDQRVEQIRQTKLRERAALEQAQEQRVHLAITTQIPHDAERMTKEELFQRLSPEALELSPELCKRYCGTFARRKAEQREAALRAAEQAIKDALATCLHQAFCSGALPVDMRWQEFREQDESRSKRVPQLNEILLSFAGKEALVERVFRQSRSEAQELVAQVSRLMQERLPHISHFSRRADCASIPEILDELNRLDDAYGRGIVDYALLDQAQRFIKNKDRFFELLSRYVREKREGVWESVQPLIADRTAYREMGSDAARRHAFAEYVARLVPMDGRSRPPPPPPQASGGRRRSRSPPRRGGGGGAGTRWQ